MGCCPSITLNKSESKDDVKRFKVRQIRKRSKHDAIKSLQSKPKELVKDDTKISSDNQTLKKTSKKHEDSKQTTDNTIESREKKAEHFYKDVEKKKPEGLKQTKKNNIEALKKRPKEIVKDDTKLSPTNQMLKEDEERKEHEGLKQTTEYFLVCDSCKSLNNEIKAANKTGLRIQVIEFYNMADCDITEEIHPELESMAKEFSDHGDLVIFMRIDCSRTGVSFTYNIVAHPTYVIFCDGKEIDRLVGPQVDAEMIKVKVKKHLTNKH